MESFGGRTAVITGAGSGLGFALARALAAERARLVLADVNADDLAKAEATLRASGAETTSVVTDVAWERSVDALAEGARAHFGAIHLLFNNAGVAISGPIWEHTAADWKWVIGVNLLGVVNGVRSFVPGMLQHGEPAHIVNTASVAGLISPPGFSAYTVTKHAVVAYSEVLYQDLRKANAPIGVSVLCPAYFPTRISDSARNRPAALRNAAEGEPDSENEAARETRRAVERGKLSADDIARITLDGVRGGRFYILPHPAIKPSIEWRMRDILDERVPTNPMQKREAAASDGGPSQVARPLGQAERSEARGER
jgi:NAD(P)-dependent dehydrogenase (short-subunit alcohol dehydrogenase family)